MQVGFATKARSEFLRASASDLLQISDAGPTSDFGGCFIVSGNGKDLNMTTTLIINAVLSLTFFAVIVGMVAWGIRTSRSNVLVARAERRVSRAPARERRSSGRPIAPRPSFDH
jgi:hypothetical protein